MIGSDIFEDLFVLEMTNNHLGMVERGLKIIREHSTIVRHNKVHAAIKLQFRDIDSFIHRDYVHRLDIKYIKRIRETKLSKEEYATLVEAIRNSGCVPMATPFDEMSVKWCLEFDMPIIKVASVDINDWPLLKSIANTNKPVIVSTGGASLQEIDDIVSFFEKKNIPIALNHCVSAYPVADSNLELHQIDFLRKRYPNHVIGFSSHEHCDWMFSIAIAYAKGARLFERHIDIEDGSFQISQYSSLPKQIDVWLKSYHKAKEMCGSALSYRKPILAPEEDHLESHTRGCYAKTDLAKGKTLCETDIYLAIPLIKGQLSSHGLKLDLDKYEMITTCAENQPIMKDMVRMFKLNMRG